METIEDKIARHGRSLITNFYILVRITKIYDSMNDTIINVSKRFMADLQPLLAEAGEVSLKVIEGSFYIEGTRIKAGMNEIESFTALAEECSRKGIGMLDFVAPLTRDDLIRLAYAIKSEEDASAVQRELEHSPTRNITVGGPVVLQEEEGIDLKDSGAVARRAYLKALGALKETDAAIKSGSRLKLKKIKRALQLVVDCILTDEGHLLRLTRFRNGDNYYFRHPVNVAVLSAALGKRIGLGRLHLRNLALSAFFHDIGKVEIPQSFLGKREDFTPKEMELIRRHPVDGIKVLLKSLGLNETTILSMLVSFEHHMRIDLSGYPPTASQRKLNLFSRIVSIADDYDSLVSGMVYGRTRIEPTAALKKMKEGKGSIYDPVLLKAFPGIFA